MINKNKIGWGKHVRNKPETWYKNQTKKRVFFKSEHIYSHFFPDKHFSICEEVDLWIIQIWRSFPGDIKKVIKVLLFHKENDFFPSLERWTKPGSFFFLREIEIIFVKTTEQILIFWKDIFLWVGGQMKLQKTQVPDNFFPCGGKIWKSWEIETQVPGFFCKNLAEIENKR